MSQCTKPEALKTQVGGNHYSKMQIQPMEFAMANRWDAGAFSILKYLTRHRDKNGLQDLQKARHFVDLRCALLPYDYRQPLARLSVGTYCHANSTQIADAQALDCLESWVMLGGDRYRLELIVAIDNLMRDVYGQVTGRVV